MNTEYVGLKKVDSYKIITQTLSIALSIDAVLSKKKNEWNRRQKKDLEDTKRRHGATRVVKHIMNRVNMASIGWPG